MNDSMKSSPDVGTSSETNPKVLYMRDYMRKRRIAKRFGWTVSQWEAAGSPLPGGEATTKVSTEVGSSIPESHTQAGNDGY